MESGATSVIVRAVGRWWLSGLTGAADPPARGTAAPVSGDGVSEIDLADVLAVVEGAGPGPGDLTAGSSPPVPPSHAVVTPRPLVAGLVVAGGVLSEDADGAPLLVDRAALSVMDHLHAPATVADLERRAAATTSASFGAAVACLVAAGWAEVTVAPADPPAEVAPPEAVASAPVAPPEVAPAEELGRGERAAALASAVSDRVATAWRLSSKLRRLRRTLGIAEPAAVAVTAPSVAATPPSVAATPPAVAASDPVPAPVVDPRVPVFAVWHPGVGVPLALGMITAYARIHEDGAVGRRYDIGRPQSADDVLAALAAGTGPAVLLCSDYLWTVDDNLDVARRAKALRPELIVIHGGPSCPKYDGESEEFLRRHADAADVVVRGEGELTVARLLAAAQALPTLDVESVRAVEGLSFLGADGRFVRTPDAERIADLNSLPSPYLSGEFDDVPFEEWGNVIPLETNRGCPYKCTFCDWGASIASRVRFFDLDRVRAEIEWVARTGRTVYITDANFGMAPRDREIAREIARVRRRTGEPRAVYFTTAKRSSTHLVEILDTLTAAGIATDTSLSLQSTDPDTLAAVERRNISTEHYLELARAFRVRGQPPVAELMVGLPGQTTESYRRDLQFAIDHGLQARTWETRVLPNSPMNDPAYRDRWGIRTVPTRSGQLIVSTATFSEADRRRMLRLRLVANITDRLAVARHVWRYLQWDHGIEATVAMERLVGLVERDPESWPRLAWLVNHFSRFPTPPGGWSGVVAELYRVVTDEFGVDAGSDLDAVFAVQELVLPRHGRALPATVDLAHDYVAYFRDATAAWYTSTGPARAVRPLSDYGPGTFTVEADPLDLCRSGIWFDAERLVSGAELDSDDFFVGTRTGNELVSAVAQPSLTSLGAGIRVVREDLPDVAVVVDGRDEEDAFDDDGPAAVSPGAPGASPVRLVPRTGAR